MASRPDPEVRIGIYTFRVDQDLAVDPDECRSFLERFVERQAAAVTDWKARERSLETEFGEHFGCGVVASYSAASGTSVVVLVTGHGTPNTTPARRPRGPEPR